MNNIISYYQSAVGFLKKKENRPYIVFFLILFIIFIINAFHEKYPDEFDNILGGWYLIHGIPIYKGFFTHHGPFAYFLAGFIELFSGNSFVLFRVFYNGLLFSFCLGTYLYIRHRFGEVRTRFYLLFLFTLAIAGNYYWLHMLLADSLSAFLLTPVLVLLLLATFYKVKLIYRDLVIISLLIAFSVLSSLTYIYVALLLYIYSFLYYIFTNRLTIFSKRTLLAVLILAVPYIVFLLYLLMTVSLQDYFRQAIEFNEKYYIYNYPRPDGSSSINPLRFAIVISNTFYNNYFTLLQQVKDFNFGFPLNISMAVGTFATAIYLVIKRNYYFAALFMLLLVFANARSNPLTSGETDYQAAVYIVFAFLAMSFLLMRLYRELQLDIGTGKKLIFAVLFLVVGMYALFSNMFLFQKYFNRSYAKYMGNAPLIYDRPEIAPVMNSLISADEAVWIGPFEFEELFFTKGVPATKYHILLPGMGSSPEIQKEMITQLDASKPTVIWFQSSFFILGRSPEQYGQFFIDYLHRHYVTLSELQEEGITYQSLVPRSEKIDLENRLYIRKEKRDEVIQKLLSQDLIKERE